MFEQVKLGYDFAALEPHIDQLTMETHYGKHHAGYTNNLNKALEQLPQLQGKTIEEILKNLEAIEDAALRTAVRNNGGGYYNHNLYFQILSPQGASLPRANWRSRSTLTLVPSRTWCKSLLQPQLPCLVQAGPGSPKTLRQTGCNQYAQPGQSS